MRRKDRALAETTALLVLKKSRLDLGNRGERVSAAERLECLALVCEAHQSGARKELACELIGINRRTVERWETRPEDLRQGPTTPSNALTKGENEAILKISNSLEYANLPPGQIVPRLADLGIYLASESTFYRLFKANDLLAHRSKSQPHCHKKPEPLMATSPNQLWSWDITYLRAEVRGMFYYLYLPMDIILKNDCSLGNSRYRIG